MYRPLVLLAVVLVMLGGAGRSAAQDGTATPEPTPPAELCAAGAGAPWESRIDVRPPQADAALTFPLDLTDDPADTEDTRLFYLVVWTLQPGTCVPYASEANSKDGAVILLVQQGIVEYTWQPYPGSSGQVLWGRTAIEGVDDGETLDPGDTLTLYPGDWVVQDDRTWFTFSSVGGESAVVVKAVFAKPPVDIGCAGGCK